jgi:hypothetical protein
MPHDNAIALKHPSASVEGLVIIGFTNAELEENIARQFQACQMDFSAQTKLSL